MNGPYSFVARNRCARRGGAHCGIKWPQIDRQRREGFVTENGAVFGRCLDGSLEETTQEMDRWGENACLHAAIYFHSFILHLCCPVTLGSWDVISLRVQVMEITNVPGAQVAFLGHH